jgi:hypothetical protein
MHLALSLKKETGATGAEDSSKRCTLGHTSVRLQNHCSRRMIFEHVSVSNATPTVFPSRCAAACATAAAREKMPRSSVRLSNGPSTSISSRRGREVWTA